MRKVLFAKWIPAQYLKSEGGIRKLIEGTGIYTPINNEGKFHQWGLMADDGLSETVAIIEEEDGSIYEAIPHKIKFIS